LPPLTRRGWRSWNVFSANINHTIIEANMAAITAKSHQGKSLADLGYIEFGIDEGWERKSSSPARHLPSSA